MPKEFVVVMEKMYPFGELGEVLAEDTKALVQKSLKITCQEQRQIIGNMVHFLKVAKHSSLINLEKVLEGSQEVQLYYEYAHFKLEKWIVTVDEDLLEALEEQMLELAEHLTRIGIKFAFNPEYLGLSKEMSVKYFLNEFTIDFEGQEEHFEELKIDICKFFKEMSCSASGNQETEYAKQCPRLTSVSTNASISPLDELITLTTQSLKKSEAKGAKNVQLSAKVENSMKKSLEALLRFKKMNSK